MERAEREEEKWIEIVTFRHGRESEWSAPIIPALGPLAESREMRLCKWRSLSSR